jgi:hypothetical protein
MSKIWEWSQAKVGYFCLAFFGTLGVLELFEGHWWWAAMDLTAAVVFCFWYQCPRSPGRLVRKAELPKCEGWHAHWWFRSKVAPPSCAERQKRNA